MAGLELLITFGLPLLAGGVGIIGVLTRHRHLLDKWQALVAKHQLVLLEASSVWAPRVTVTARAGTVGVRIENVPKRGIWVELTIPGPLAHSGLKLRRESLIPWAREIETGDGPFDQAFLVEGEAARATALLDARTRRLLLEVNEKGELELRDGVLRVKVTDRTLPDLLPPLLELGQRFTQGPDVVRRLAANARRDPRAGVRLRNLLLLAREHRSEALTTQTLRAACSDENPQIRLRAAIERGAEGRETLVALAEDGDANDAWSAQAVSALGRQLPFERTVAVLEQALRRSRFETARACLAALGPWGGGAIGELVKALAHQEDTLAATAALALGETGDEAAEPPLLRALQHDNPEVRAAAASALGRVGTAAAVLPLQRAAEDDRGVRRAARQAIAEIQSRLQGAAPGQLSLADAEAGQLSLAQAEAGQLSLAPEPAAGPLSLPPARQRA